MFSVVSSDKTQCSPHCLIIDEKQRLHPFLLSGDLVVFAFVQCVKLVTN